MQNTFFGSADVKRMKPILDFSLTQEGSIGSEIF